MLLVFPLAATTISPYPNLGEMALASEAVVLAQVERNYTIEENGMSRYRSWLRVVSSIKGELDEGDSFALQNYHTRIGELERTIWGDIELLEDGTYLLFLSELYSGVWQATMLSYGALELQKREGIEVLVPFDLGQEVHLHVQEGQVPPEPLGVYFKDRLLNSLKSIVRGTAQWNRELVLTHYTPNQFTNHGRGTEPPHCTFLSSGADPARWENIESTAIPVRYAAAGASDCASAGTEVGDAISTIAGSYLGVNLSNAGTHSYVPSCSGGEGATDSEFTTWVNTNLGGSQHILVQFDDPCSEIADLSGCNGTLAIGGLYWFGSTYTNNGMTWRRAAYGYVVFNNGTGTCNCSSSNYEIIMTHELTHTLNIGHIEEVDGMANMNPNCCITIQPLDVECLDFIYPPSFVPVELRSFTGQKDKETVQLKWISETEVDNDFYELERLNRDGKFESIYRTNGVGTTYDPQSYNFTDYKPLLGTNTYRLSQTDFDGTRKELGIVGVEFYGKGGLTVELSPNPIAEQGANIYVYSPEDRTAQLSISSLAGQRLVDQQVQLARGINYPDIDFNKLPAGIYLLQLSQGDEQRVVRFVKD